MKTFKNLVVAVIILCGAIGIPLLVNRNDNLYFLILIPIALVVFHLTARNNISFKSYFLSKWNILTSKFSNDVKLDIPRELLFDKLLEIIESSPFKLKYANKQTFEILITSRMSWLSWGENIYIELKKTEGETIIHWDSVTFQAHSWGKNERNFESFLRNFEESLTV